MTKHATNPIMAKSAIDRNPPIEAVIILPNPISVVRVVRIAARPVLCIILEIFAFAPSPSKR